MFDLSLPKLLVLAVIALVIFGPNELPQIAAQTGRALRDLRKIAEDDLREGLGPEFADFEIDDLNPSGSSASTSPAIRPRTREPSSSPRARPQRTARLSRRASARRPTRTRHEPRASTWLPLRPRTIPTVPLETRGPLPGEAEQVGRGVADRDDGGGRARHQDDRARHAEH